MKRALNIFFLLAMGIWSLGPFVWQWLTSVKDPAAVSRIPPLLPDMPIWTNYASVLQNREFMRVIGNSLAVSLGALGVALIVGSLGAFGISRFLNRRKHLALLTLLVVFMIPPVSVVTPFYSLLVRLRLMDTLAGLILIDSVFCVPLVVWVMVQVFDEIPDSLYRAARVDGCPAWTIFRRIYLPLGQSGLISAGLLCLMFCWNEFLFALTFTSTYAARTIPVGITLFSGQFEFPWGEISAATSLVTFPLLLIVVFAQRYLVRGLAGSGLKG